MNFIIWKSCKSVNYSTCMFVALNNGEVCSLYAALMIVRTALFWMIFRRVVYFWYASSHKKMSIKETWVNHGVLQHSKMTTIQDMLC